MHKRYYIILPIATALMLLSLLTTPLSTLTAQEDSTHRKVNHNVALKVQFAQYKDEFNYGLVFSGSNVGVNYTYQRTLKKGVVVNESDLAFALNANKGLGVAVLLKPFDISYSHRIISPNVLLGVYGSTTYQWQLYPDLQSGHMFWISSFEIGPQMTKHLKYRTKEIKLSLSNSLIGLTSRPAPSTETYYYTLKFSDFIKNAHQDLQFGSLNTYNHTSLRIDLVNKSSRNLNFGYEFEYYGYYKAPEISILYHSINLTWKLGKK